MTRRNGRDEVVLPSLVGQALGAVEGLGQAAHRLLGPVHQIAIIGVRQIELQHREFGVVPRGQPLVAEVAVDLVHPLEAAHHQALQIQLRRDAQVQVHVQGVVMRDEGPRRGTARDGLHHGRLDFEEVEGVHEVAQVLHDAGAGAEHVPAASFMMRSR